MVDLLSTVPYYTGHLCHGFQECEGVEVTLASITYQHDPACFRRQGIQNDPGLLDVTHRLGCLPALARRILKLGEYTVNMAALLARFIVSRPDVVHVQFFPLIGRGFPIEAWWLRAVRMLGVRVVYTVHNVLPQDGRQIHSAHRGVYRLADRLVCHDRAAARRLIAEFGTDEGRVVTIPHGPLFERRRCGETARAREGLGLAPEEPLVLWQGIVRPYKGVSFLLNAWRVVCEGNSTACLAIAGTGDPDLLQSVKDQVQALGLAARVRLDLRFVPLSELDDLYDAADVLVYPYSEITTSGALLTGIARGKAVIASRLPAFEQILRHEETALLVPYGNVSALAGALLRLIGDAALRDALRTRLAERQAAIPRWDEIAERTSECYRALLSERGKYVSQTV